MSELEKALILIVDDSATIRNTISKYLNDKCITIHASNGEEAWQLIETNRSISLVFADMHMPVMNGMALLKRISASSNTRIANLPVIMITGHEDTDAAKRASYNLGASDFISKPFSELDIVSRANAYVKFSQKIASLEQNVSHDELTGLFNNAGFKEIGTQAIAGAHRHAYELSMLSMQISNIDEIFNKYGKKIASQIIVAVSNNLKKSLRKEEALSHLGSGQFSMFLPMTKSFRARIVALRFQKAVSSLVFKIGVENIRISLAVGLNSTEEYDHKVCFDDLFNHVEKALHISLQDHNYNIVNYDEILQKQSLETLPGKVMNVFVDKKDKAEIPQTNQFANDSNDQFQIINTSAFSRYMSMILNDEFDKIPKQDIHSLVSPLQSFLNYVEEQKYIEEMATENNFN